MNCKLLAIVAMILSLVSCAASFGAEHAGEGQHVRKPAGFVHSKDGTFKTDDGAEKLQLGWNMHRTELLQAAADAAKGLTARKIQIHDVLYRLAEAGFDVIRVPVVATEDTSILTSPCVYNYSMWQGVDYLVYAAHAMRLKVILVIADSSTDSFLNRKFLKWASMTSGNGFYSNNTVKQKYMEYLKDVLTWTNTFNHLSYMEDSSVLSWELETSANCSVMQSNKACLEELTWANEIANFIKSVDSNHMVGVTFSPSSVPWESDSRDAIPQTLVSAYDYMTVRCWPGLLSADATTSQNINDAANFISAQMSVAAQLKMPLLLQETDLPSNSPAKVDQLRGLWYDVAATIIAEAGRLGSPLKGGNFLVWQEGDNNMELRSEAQRLACTCKSQRDGGASSIAACNSDQVKQHVTVTQQAVKPHAARVSVEETGGLIVVDQYAEHLEDNEQISGTKSASGHALIPALVAAHTASSQDDIATLMLDDLDEIEANMEFFGDSAGKQAGKVNGALGAVADNDDDDDDLIFAVTADAGSFEPEDKEYNTQPLSWTIWNENHKRYSSGAGQLTTDALPQAVKNTEAGNQPEKDQATLSEDFMKHAGDVKTAFNHHIHQMSSLIQDVSEGPMVATYQDVVEKETERMLEKIESMMQEAAQGEVAYILQNLWQEQLKDYAGQIRHVIDTMADQPQERHALTLEMVHYVKGMEEEMRATLKHEVSAVYQRILKQEFVRYTERMEKLLREASASQLVGLYHEFVEPEIVNFGEIVRNFADRSQSILSASDRGAVIKLLGSLEGLNVEQETATQHAVPAGGGKDTADSGADYADHPSNNFDDSKWISSYLRSSGNADENEDEHKEQLSQWQLIAPSDLQHLLQKIINNAYSFAPDHDDLDKVNLRGSRFARGAKDLLLKILPSHESTTGSKINEALHA